MCYWYLFLCYGTNGQCKEKQFNGNKIEQALEGINRIDRKLEETSKTQNSAISVIKAHEEQIKTLFSRFDELRNRCETSDNVQNAIHER